MRFADSELKAEIEEYSNSVQATFNENKPFDAKLTQIYRDEARHGKALKGLLDRYFK